MPPPTTPVNVTLPVPELTVSVLASVAALSTAPENVTALSVVASVIPASNTTASPYA